MVLKPWQLSSKLEILGLGWTWPLGKTPPGPPLHSLQLISVKFSVFIAAWHLTTQCASPHLTAPRSSVEHLNLHSGGLQPESK